MNRENDIAPRALAPAEAHRQVSVLFTDMVGYTAAIERLGEDRSLSFTRAVYDLLAGIVQAEGGVVGGFGGDSVMAVFGIPDALEDGALRACRAALALQQAFAERADGFRARYDTVPVMRVGISSGTVVVAQVQGGDAPPTVVGATVNLASRIQSLAPAGGCLLCDRTRGLVEWAANLSFDDVHDIRGVERPQKLWRLNAIRAGATRFGAALARGLGPHVGRAAELAGMIAMIDQARGRVRVIDILGEAGLGKSRLAHEFQHLVAQEGLRVLLGHCARDGRQTPFFPFLEVVRRAFRIPDDAPPDEVADRLRDGLSASGLMSNEAQGLLLNLLGLAPPAGALDGLDGLLIGLRTRNLLSALLRVQCRTALVLLQIEDLHWIDAASEQLLAEVIADPAQSNLLLVQTRRPGQAPGWIGDARVHKIALQPLAADDIAVMIRARLGVDDLPAPLTDRIALRAGGNPLFGEEILTFLLDRGALRVEDGQVRFDDALPEDDIPGSIRALFDARIDRLPPGPRGLLQAAAVIGRRFDPALLSQVMQRPERIGEDLRRLEAQDFVFRDSLSSDYLFKHILLRDAVYKGLLAERRADLHFTIAEALVQRNAGQLSEVAEALAHHYDQTPRTDLAFTYNAMAGAKSLGTASLTEASRYFAKAMAHCQRDPDCVTPKAFAEFVADYGLCNNIALHVTIMLDMAPRVRPVLDRIGDSLPHALFLHHLVNCLICACRYADAWQVQQSLSAMADRLGDPKSQAYALASELALSCYYRALSSDAFETRQRRAEAALEQFDDAYLANFLTAYVGWNELMRGRVTRAVAAADRILKTGMARGDPRSLGYGLAMKALIAMISYDYAKALEFADQALAASRAEFERAIAMSARCGAIIPLGVAGARAEVEAYVAACASRGWTLFRSGPETILGVACALEGRLGESLNRLEAIIRDLEARGNLAAAGWNRLFLCEILLEILSGKEMPPPRVLWRNLRTLLAVKLFGAARIEAQIALVRANPVFDAQGHYIARSEMILGLLNKARKRPAEARAQLQRALAIVEPAGASGLLSRIQAALADLPAA
ncbi:AAA family ATPase [bacterium]|nr:AAA family ATPase [bacterium]